MRRRRRKLSLKTDRVSKPASKAISAIGRSPARSSAEARSIRRRQSISDGVAW